MFLCREAELEQLNKRFRRAETECIVIYGRRRVGKTALINEFTKDKKRIYFPALKANKLDNLEALSKSIHQFLSPGAISYPVYSSFDDAFAAITDIVKKDRVIFVIDELPYLCEADSSIPSRLQHLLDHDWAGTGMFLILCGSSMSFMEKEVLGEKSPLFGRRTAQLKIEPLHFWEAAKFHPELSPADHSLVYGITGGVPHYINKLGISNCSIKDALLENLFDPSSYLFEEPGNLLRQELREPAMYNSAITVIAEGATKPSEISSKLHIETGQLNRYLKVLIELGILEKVQPVIDNGRNKVFYRIRDSFFRFWYRFVPGNMMAVSSGNMDKIYDQAVGRYLHDFMGQTFEYMCRDYLIQHFDQLPFPVTDIGEWWGTDPRLRKEIQLDIVARGMKTQIQRSGNRYLIGSCKYRNEAIGIEELKLIEQYSSVFTTASDSCCYYIFSKGGFKDSLKDTEQNQEVKLYTLDDLYAGI